MVALTDSSKRFLPLGRVAGHRGRHGEITVRVFGGDAQLWSGVSEVWIGEAAEGPFEAHAVRSARSYRDRLVLRLAGVDDASTAAALRGSQVAVEAAAAPRLPAGQHYRALLVGLEVRVGPECIGRVVDLMAAAGHDLLVVRRMDGRGDGAAREILIPWVEAIVERVDEQSGVIQVRPPEGLLDLDLERDGGRPE